MGRGLSELQRSILRLALHNRNAEGLAPTKHLVVVTTSIPMHLGIPMEPPDVILRRIRDAGYEVICHRPEVYRDVVLLETTIRADAEAFAVRVKVSGINAVVSRDGEKWRPADVYAWEILASTYGFATGDRSGRSRVHGPSFDKVEIGERRYEAARVAVRKAFFRLEERGFARADCSDWQRHPVALTLTPVGVEVAEGLTATAERASSVAVRP